MSHNRQIILDCNLPGELTCVLAEDSAPAIQLNSRVNTGQYRYYLKINNHSQETCLLSMELEKQSGEEFNNLSAIIFSLSSQQNLLFQATLDQALAQAIPLRQLAPRAKDLYQLDWQINEIDNPLRFDFALNFSFDCAKLGPTSSTAQVLGQQTVEGSLIDTKQAKAIVCWLMIAFLVSLLILIAIKLLTSSEERKSHEPEKNH